MFDHVTIRVSSRDASEPFYDLVLETLGIEKTYGDEHFVGWSDFSLAEASDEKPVTRRLHVAFVAPSRAHVDEFWRVATEAGHRDDGPPGPRPQYAPDYYGAFVLDDDGNSVEAVHLGDRGRGGVVDHLWIRVPDVAEATRFYETIARYAGLRLATDEPERAQFAGESGSFSLLAGTPTENVHIAFPAGDTAAVHAFHRAAVEAGYRDNGAPGPRPEYGEGYYAAFVLDPAGHNVELVHHRRP